MLSVTLSRLCQRCQHSLTGLTPALRAVQYNTAKWRLGDLQFLAVVEPVRFAGHSHWHNVRHIKDAKDAQKQTVSLSICRRIRIAVREGGSTDPKLNSRLARILEEGKAKDVSNSTMMELLKRLEKGKEMQGSQLYIEARAIGNSSIIAETFTDKPKWTRGEIQHVLKKYGGAIGNQGTVMHSFHHKGVIYLPSQGENSLTKDEALDGAIEVGAEEVLEGLDDDEQPAYQFICDPKELHSVKKALEDKGLQIRAARFEYVPHSFVLLDSATLELASDMLDELEAIDSVVRVFDNIDSLDSAK